MAKLESRPRRRVLALLVLAATAYAVAWRYDAPRGPSDAWLGRLGLTARQAEVDGLQLRYVRHGRGPTLVLIHGFASSLYTWSEVLPELARTHDVVAFDLPGFGGSDMPADLSWPVLPRAVLALMDRLGVGRATLVGHSLGGAVVLTVAAQSPERVDGLVLIDSAGFNVDPRARPKLVGLAASPALGAVAGVLPLRRALATRGLRQVFHDDARVTPERVEEYVAPLRRAAWLPAMRSLLTSRQRELEGFPALLPRVRAPTLILWGREDAWAPLEQAARFQAGIAGSRVVIFAACGHVPHEEQPAEALRALRSFLDAPRPTPAGQP